MLKFKDVSILGFDERDKEVVEMSIGIKRSKVLIASSPSLARVGHPITPYIM